MHMFVTVIRLQYFMAKLIQIFSHWSLESQSQIWFQATQKDSQPASQPAWQTNLFMEVAPRPNNSSPSLISILQWVLYITRLRSKVFSLGRLWVWLKYSLQRLEIALKYKNNLSSTFLWAWGGGGGDHEGGLKTLGHNLLTYIKHTY